MPLTDAEQRELLTKVRELWNDRAVVKTARDAAVSFAWEGWPQLGVHPDGPYKGKPLSFVDYCVRKFGRL